MAENKIIGYKKVFGFVMPDWVDEKSLNYAIGYFLVAAVMAIVLVVFINPNKSTVKKLEAQYKVDSQRLTNLSESKRSLDRLLVEISANEQDAIFKAMPSNYSPDEAVYSFRMVANEAGVSVKEYTLPQGLLFEEGKKEFGGTGSKDKDNSISFNNFVVQVTVEGSVANILKFISLVQKTLPIAFVSDLNIQEAVKISEIKGGRRAVTLKLSVQYYQPVLKTFNLAGLQSFTSAETELMKELAEYNQKLGSTVSRVGTSSGQVGDLNKDLFGF